MQVVRKVALRQVRSLAGRRNRYPELITWAVGHLAADRGWKKRPNMPRSHSPPAASQLRFTTNTVLTLGSASPTPSGQFAAPILLVLNVVPHPSRASAYGAMHRQRVLRFQPTGWEGVHRNIFAVESGIGRPVECPARSRNRDA